VSNEYSRALQPADTCAGKELYAAILARRSVRQYEQSSLNREMLARVREAVDAVQPLASGSDFDVLFRDISPGENLVETLGAYGRIVSPPHMLVPYLAGEAAHLTDLGYRVQQIVIQLTVLGLGSCYIGCLPWEDQARARFGLSESVRLGATVVYGRPAKGRSKRAFNAAVRRLVGATNKRPAEQSFYDTTWERPTAPPAGLADLVEAARHAPSADNAQPWRFLWRDGLLHLYVVRSSWRYRIGGSQDYRFYDGGICMANILLAMQALGMTGQWELLEDGRSDLLGCTPGCPDELQPLAVLRLE
jgi:nitroreductase